MRSDKLVRNDLSPAVFVWYRQYLEAVEQRDLAAYSEFIFEDCILAINNQPPIQGKSAILMAMESAWRDMPPMEHDLLNIIGSDNHFTLEALNIFDVDGAARNVRAAAVTERGADGKARSVSLYFDPAPLLQGGN